jgi:hypothetical protein
MKKIMMAQVLLAIALPLLPTSSAHGEEARQSFGFNAVSIKGFPSGEAFLTGGGAYDPQTGFLKAGGTFRCLADINQGPLAGCKAGEGIRWDVADETDTGPLLPSVQFKCTGSVDQEDFKTAVTDDNTVVMIADFYRQGDGTQESFTAKMFVSTDDEADDLLGTQNVWIQGVGCGDANVHFNP